MLNYFINTKVQSTFFTEKPHTQFLAHLYQLSNIFAQTKK